MQLADYWAIVIVPLSFCLLWSCWRHIVRCARISIFLLLSWTCCFGSIMPKSCSGVLMPRESFMSPQGLQFKRIWMMLAVLINSSICCHLILLNSTGVGVLLRLILGSQNCFEGQISLGLFGLLQPSPHCWGTVCSNRICIICGVGTFVTIVWKNM